MPKQYIIFDEPNIADPAWLIKCAEILSNGDVVQHNNFNTIQATITRARERAAYEEGRNAENVLIYKFLQARGLNERDYMKFTKEEAQRERSSDQR